MTDELIGASQAGLRGAGRDGSFGRGGPSRFRCRSLRRCKGSCRSDRGRRRPERELGGRSGSVHRGRGNRRRNRRGGGFRASRRGRGRRRGRVRRQQGNRARRRGNDGNCGSGTCRRMRRTCRRHGTCGGRILGARRCGLGFRCRHLCGLRLNRWGRGNRCGRGNRWHRRRRRGGMRQAHPQIRPGCGQHREKQDDQGPGAGTLRRRFRREEQRGLRCLSVQVRQRRDRPHAAPLQVFQHRIENAHSCAPGRTQRRSSRRSIMPQCAWGVSLAAARISRTLT